MLLPILLLCIFLIGREIIRFLPELSPRLAFIYSWGFGLLLLYPVGLIQVALIEGRERIYVTHIYSELAILGVLLVLLHLLANFFAKKPDLLITSGQSLFSFKFVMFTLVAALAVLWKIDAPTINGDERELNYRAYDLVDGFKAGRRAFVISFNDHAPLGNYISHFVMNALHPEGFLTAKENIVRSPSSLMAVLSFIAMAVLAYEWWGKSSKLYVMILTLFNTAFIFSGRLAIPQDLATWNFFFLLSLHAFLYWLETKKSQWLILSAIFCGALTLTKFTGIVIVTIYLVIWLLQHKSIKPVLLFSGIVGLITSPLFVYNLGAYVVTNHVDVPTSIFLRKIGIEVGSIMGSQGIYAGQGGSVLQNFPNLLLTLADLTQPIVLFLLVGLSGLALVSRIKYVGTLTLIWFGITLFYSVMGFRVYYLTVLVVLLLLTSGAVIPKISNWAKLALLAIVISISFWYTTGSIYSVDVKPQPSIGEYGRSSEKIPPLSLSRHYSYSINSWLYIRGWRYVIDELDREYASGPVVVDDELSLPRARWYLGDDLVRRMHEPSFEPKYLIKPLSQRDQIDCDRTIYLIGHADRQYSVCNRVPEKIFQNQQVPYDQRVALFIFPLAEIESDP